MATSGSGPDCLLDTSAAVAFVQPTHVAHQRVLEAVVDRRRGLAGHAAFECLSVLTRLPGPQRVSPSSAQRLLVTNFPHTKFLGAEAAAGLFDELADHRIAGGAVYDALVGAVSREYAVPLVSRDHRAAETYRALSVEVELL